MARQRASAYHPRSSYRPLCNPFWSVRVPDLSKITCIEDLRVIAQRRVPRMFYDYADSGSYTEGTYRANESDFQRIKLRQRVAVNMEGRSTRTTMVGHGHVLADHGGAGAAALHVHGHALAQLDALKVAFVGTVGALGVRTRIGVVIKHARHTALGNDTQVFNAGDFGQIGHADTPERGCTGGRQDCAEW